MTSTAKTADGADPPGDKRVACPHCRREAVYGPSNPWRPFCSERCRSIDLGAWASEQFRVPAENPPDMNEAADGPGAEPRH